MFTRFTRAAGFVRWPSSLTAESADEKRNWRVASAELPVRILAELLPLRIGLAAKRHAAHHQPWTKENTTSAARATLTSADVLPFLSALATGHTVLVMMNTCGRRSHRRVVATGDFVGNGARQGQSRPNLTRVCLASERHPITQQTTAADDVSDAEEWKYGYD